MLVPTIKNTHPDFIQFNEVNPALALVAINEFTEESSNTIREGIIRALQAPQPVVPLLIDSFGGEVYSCFSLIDLIQEVEKIKPVATIVTGKAMSAGLILASMGTKGYRYASPNSVFMIHEAQSFVGGGTEDIVHAADHVQKLTNKFLHMMGAHCKDDINYFTKLLSKYNNIDLTMFAKDAKRHGLIDHIGLPKVEVQASLTYKWSK